MAVYSGGADSLGGYVDVMPLVCQIDNFHNTLSPYTLYHLPYSRIQGGIAALVIDPQPGDIGLAVFAKRDSSRVKPGQAEPVGPGSFRCFDQADGFYIGGFLNKAPESWLEIDPVSGDISLSTKTANVDISCRESGNIEINAKSGNVSLKGSQAINIVAPLINLWGKVNVNGSLIADGVNINSHIHIEVEPGHGESGPSKGSGAETAAERFVRVKQDLLYQDNLTDKDRLLLCMPDIAQAMAERMSDAKNRIGWLYLRDMFYKWFSGPANQDAQNNFDLFLVEWDWVMSFSRSQIHYERFTKDIELLPDDDRTSNIYNLAAKAEIGKLLKERYMLAGMEIGQSMYFDFTPPQADHHYDWYKWSFNYITVPRQRMPVRDGGSAVMADGLQASLGSFAFRAFAAGRVKKIAEHKYHITVTDCWVFAHDKFAFEDDDYFWFWSCEEKKFWVLDPMNPFDTGVGMLESLHLIEPVETENSVNCLNLRDFRSRLGYGNAFTVVSSLHKVENYKGMDYDYPL
jgi:hypothetical protein